MRTPIAQLSPTAVADKFFQDEGSICSNPYPPGSGDSVEFCLRFNAHLNKELDRIREELEAGI